MVFISLEFDQNWSSIYFWFAESYRVIDITECIGFWQRMSLLLMNVQSRCLLPHKQKKAFLNVQSCNDNLKPVVLKCDCKSCLSLNFEREDEIGSCHSLHRCEGRYLIAFRDLEIQAVLSWCRTLTGAQWWTPLHLGTDMGPVFGVWAPVRSRIGLVPGELCHHLTRAVLSWCRIHPVAGRSPGTRLHREWSSDASVPSSNRGISSRMAWPALPRWCPTRRSLPHDKPEDTNEAESGR